MKKLLTGCLVASALLFTVNTSFAGDCYNTKNNCECQTSVKAKDCNCQDKVKEKHTCSNDCTCGCQDKSKENYTCSNDCTCGCQNEKKDPCKKENFFKRMWSKLF